MYVCKPVSKPVVLCDVIYDIRIVAARVIIVSIEIRTPIPVQLFPGENCATDETVVGFCRRFGVYAPEAPQRGKPRASMATF